MPLGSDSSMRMRIVCKCRARLLQNAYCHRVADRGKLIEENFQRVPFLDEIKKIFDRNARAAENGSAALNFGINDNERLRHRMHSSKFQSVSLSRVPRARQRSAATNTHPAIASSNASASPSAGKTSNTTPVRCAVASMRLGKSLRI